jgi:hypothetical protein
MHQTHSELETPERVSRQKNTGASDGRRLANRDYVPQAACRNQEVASQGNASKELAADLRFICTV